MRHLIYTLLVMFSSSISFGQVKNLDFEKFEKCKLNIGINYQDREKDYLEAQNYREVEIILIHAKKDGKVKSFERGYISTLVKGNYKGTFFASEKSKNSDQKAAKFPLFDAKNYYVYSAKCFDEINRE
jgi:hypothetical protein